MTFRSVGACIVLATGLHLGAYAQTPEPSSHMKAATALLEAMNTEKTVDDVIDLTLKAQIEANPQIAPFEGVMRDFLGKYMSWDVLRDDYAKLYMESFTEPELKELTKFYKTPVGRKLVGALPQIMRKGAELGQNAVASHIDELREKITKKLEESETAPEPEKAPETP
jgi:hypothetical protein